VPRESTDERDAILLQESFNGESQRRGVHGFFVGMEQSAPVIRIHGDLVRSKHNGWSWAIRFHPHNVPDALSDMCRIFRRITARVQLERFRGEFFFADFTVPQSPKLSHQEVMSAAFWHCAIGSYRDDLDRRCILLGECQAGQFRNKPVGNLDNRSIVQPSVNADSVRVPTWRGHDVLILEPTFEQSGHFQIADVPAAFGVLKEQMRSAR
jgi:hypothetical protein